MMINTVLILLALCANLAAKDLDTSQWRGPGRNGVYNEKQLLKKWPENGPEMLWSYEGLGNGYGTVAVTKKRIFVVGEIDSLGHLFSFNLSGKLLWKKQFGREWMGSYPGARTTPTIVADRLYLVSGMGRLYCFNVADGSEFWSVDLLERFNAENIRWGMTEALLIDGDRLICTPGGPEENIAVLDRFTGETILTSKGHGEPAAYCSPILVNHNGTRLIVTMTAESIIGVDADDGTFYWRVPQFQGNKIHANTPVYFDGKILCSSSSAKSNSGLVLLNLSAAGKSVEVIWRNEKYRNLMGGVIVRDGYIYGGQYRKNAWCCIDTGTGEIVYTFTGLASGVITYADDMFYCYSDKGDLALVDADPEGFNIVSAMKIELGTNQHWAHPVIHAGRLYLRHGDALMVFDIQAHN
jgi:outer membrane protein assembly factor BamB